MLKKVLAVVIPTLRNAYLGQRSIVCNEKKHYIFFKYSIGRKNTLTKNKNWLTFMMIFSFHFQPCCFHSWDLRNSVMWFENCSLFVSRRARCENYICFRARAGLKLCTISKSSFLIRVCKAIFHLQECIIQLLSNKLYFVELFWETIAQFMRKIISLDKITRRSKCLNFSILAVRCISQISTFLAKFSIAGSSILILQFEAKRSLTEWN